MLFSAIFIYYPAFMQTPATHQSQHVDFWEPGFFMESAQSPSHRPLHWHNEVEVVLLERGRVTVLFGRRRYPLMPGGMAVLWGTLPHGILKATPVMLSRSLHVPLPWVLQWQLPSGLMDPILRGEIVQEPPRREPCTDTALMRHWQTLMDENSGAAREIVLLDLQRRLRLMARSLLSGAASHGTGDADEHAGAFEKMALTIAQQYRRALKVREVTATAGLSPSYGMRLFKRMGGMSIVDYLTRIRVSMAQRLLVTTDLKIEEIARQSGFNTVCRLYIAFRRICNQTPRRYRIAMRRTLAGSR
mgnify:CR=1 FL=1